MNKMWRYILKNYYALLLIGLLFLFHFIWGRGLGLFTAIMALLPLAFVIWFLQQVNFYFINPPIHRFLAMIWLTLKGIIAGAFWIFIIGCSCLPSPFQVPHPFANFSHPLLDIFSVGWIMPLIIAPLLGILVSIQKITLSQINLLILIFIFSPPIAWLFTPPARPCFSFEEEMSRNNLEKLRMAISIYYKEHKIYPPTLNTPSFKFANNIPEVRLSKIIQEKQEISHPLKSNKVLIVTTKPNQKIQPHQITDEGGWIYSSDSGDIRINCSHLDSKGIPYSSW
jgi:hypothetical protein